MKQWLHRYYLGLIFFLLYLPIAILILQSFNDSHFSWVWHGFSTHWYHVLFHDHDLWRAFFHSILLGIVASFITIIFSLLTCIHFFLSQNKHQRPLYTLLLLLIILPDLVLGVALLIFFNMTAIPLGFFSLLIAHITFCLPFTLIIIQNRMQALDVNLYYSALDLGASSLNAITSIILPLLWPALFSAFLLAFTLSFDDVIISYFIAGPDYNILPLTIYSLVRAGVSPELNALCSMTFLLSMILVVCSYRLSRKSS